MLDGDGYKCWECGTNKDEGEDYYQVKIITGDGQLFFVPCCSEVCAHKTKQKNENIHLSRYEDVKNTSIQKTT
ncbi:hypothetical protein FC959_16965 [Clostridium botulinum]|nr:hypothetical protein [Clostridium botulinum]